MKKSQKVPIPPQVEGHDPPNIGLIKSADEDRHAVCYQDNVGSLCASDYKFPQ